MLYASTKLLK